MRVQASGVDSDPPPPPEATLVARAISKVYKPWALLVVTAGYITAELGHFLIGVTSRETARDLHYGDQACLLRPEFSHVGLPQPCSSAKDSVSCELLVTSDNNTVSYCQWDYNGLGLDYQILAGPSFIAVYTVAGIFMGVAADRFNRVRLLAACTLIFGLAIVMMGAVHNYWEFMVLRMLLAFGEAGCNPLSAGLLSDLFLENNRALVMAVFNWGIYGGYGLAFPVGRYVSAASDLGWRLAYYSAGGAALVFALLTAFTLREPQRRHIGEELQRHQQQQPDQQDKIKGQGTSLWQVLRQPRLILLCIAASIRHMGGLCLGYNCDLYFQTYYPEADLQWWLFGVTIIIGGSGVVVGGMMSDKMVAGRGVEARVLALGISQLIATPLAFGSVYCEPIGAMVTLGLSYFFAEMWFGILFAILVEIVPLAVRSTTLGIFLFVMNNIGGNMPVLVEPLSKAIGYRESLWVFYVGAYLLSSILFLLTVAVMRPQVTKVEEQLETVHHAPITFTLGEVPSVNPEGQGGGIINRAASFNSVNL